MFAVAPISDRPALTNLIHEQQEHHARSYEPFTIVQLYENNGP